MRFGKEIIFPKTKQHANISFFFGKTRQSLKRHLGQHSFPSAFPKNPPNRPIIYTKIRYFAIFPQTQKTLEKSGLNAVFQGFASFIYFFACFRCHHPNQGSANSSRWRFAMQILPSVDRCRRRVPRSIAPALLTENLPATRPSSG